MAVADLRCTEKLGVADTTLIHTLSDFINVCFHLMNARSPIGSNLSVDLYACSAAFRQISL